MKRGFPTRMVTAALLMAAGVAFMAYPYLTDATYAVSQARLAMAAPSPASAGSTGGQALPAGALARIVISRIDLDAFVLEGTESETLNQAPGHYPETPLPGQDGNVCIAGHRTMYGHPFRRLDEMQPGDEIVIYTTSAKVVYRVTGTTIVDPSEVSVAAPTGDNRLTLTTCNPVGSARQRLVVSAARQ
jgi:sortase A